MKIPHLAASAAVALLVASGAAACIEALDLNEMVARTDACVRGTVTEVHSVRTSLDGDPISDARICTVVTVEGEDLYTGQHARYEMSFLGGTYEGETQVVTSMPAASDYRVGNSVIAFTAPIEGWGRVERVLYATYGGIYREVDTRKGPVILGRGKDFAIEKNMTLAQLRVGIAEALQAKAEEVNR